MCVLPQKDEYKVIFEDYQLNKDKLLLLLTQEHFSQWDTINAA